MRTNNFLRILAFVLVLGAFIPCAVTQGADKGKLTIMGALVTTNGIPVEGMTVLVRGIMKTLEDGGVGFFMTKTGTNGNFSIEIDKSHMTMNKDREFTLEGGKPDPATGIIRTSSIRNDLGVVIVFKLDPSVEKLDLGKIKVKEQEPSK